MTFKGKHLHQLKQIAESSTEFRKTTCCYSHQAITDEIVLELSIFDEKTHTQLKGVFCFHSI